MVNIIGICNLVPPLVGDPNSPKDNNNMTAKAILQCRPNSHPFPERVLSLDQPVKIGRSVARARPAKNNAIFDCKVLSRNHALLWYENGKFYLQDTKSSNGTFVNNQRLSKGSEESAPREVCSGDIVQYGVDVMENSRKVTHGCIIATLKLYMPDGQEAKASPSTTVGDGTCSISSADILHLRTCLQEAQHREQLIESKLSCLQQIISDTQEAAVHSWTAMIDEDRLLQRLETLEGQLSTYAKNYPEDATREEIQRILDEKTRYETSAKDALQRILTEKLDAVAKCSDIERSMATTKNELSYMKEKAETAQRELEELLKKQTEQTTELQEMTEKLKAADEKLNQSKDDNNSDKKEMEVKLQEQSAEEKKLLVKIESLQAEADFTKEQLSAIKSKYENMKNGRLSVNTITGSDGNELDITEGELQNTMQMFRSSVHALQEKLWQTQEESHQTQALITQLKCETEAADKAEIKSQIRRGQLQDELTEKRAKEEANMSMIDHLQSRIGVLETRLSNIESDNPKIYDDIYEDHSMTLGRYKKSLKEDDNKDEDNDKLKPEDENEESDSLSDSTMTIINSNDVVDKNSMNGTENGRFEFDSESLIYMKEDIIKLQEILQLAEASKSSAEEELKRIRDEFGQATTACVTATHEASNLHKQLAANESILLEKTRYVSTLQEVGGQLESSLELIYSHLNSLTRRVSQEKEEALNAKNQAEDFRKKLEEAEKLCKESVEEAEKLRAKINCLEESFSIKRLKVEEEDTSVSSHSDSQKTLIEDSPSTSCVQKKELEGGDLCSTNSLKVEDSGNEEEMIPKLLSQINRLQKAYDDLKEKENKLRAQLESNVSHTFKDGDIAKHRNETSGDEENVFKLKEELSNLMQEHNRLKEKMTIEDGEFGDLYLQNRVAVAMSVIPLMILVIGFVTAFYDMLSALTGTTEFHTGL